MDLPQHILEIYSQATCLYTRGQVEQALDSLANQLNLQFADSNPILLCVVLGGIVTLGNLLPRLNFLLEIDYVHASRYKGKLMGKNLLWKAYPTLPLADRTVIIVDDILDGGLTLKGIFDYCWQQKARKVYSAVLVDKLEARQPNGVAQADFFGLTVNNHYVFGYGLDYKGYLRNAPGIYQVASEYEK